MNQTAINQGQFWLEFVALKAERYWALCLEWSHPPSNKFLILLYKGKVTCNFFPTLLNHMLEWTWWLQHVGSPFVHSSAPLFTVHQCPFAPILIGFPCHCIFHIMAKEPLCIHFHWFHRPCNSYKSVVKLSLTYRPRPVRNPPKICWIGIMMVKTSRSSWKFLIPRSLARTRGRREERKGQCRHVTQCLFGQVRFKHNLLTG